MNKPYRMRTFLMVISLVLAFSLVLFLSSCILDTEDRSSSVSSGEVISRTSQVPASTDVSSLSGAESDSSDVYQDILDELDDLEDVINGLDDYTSEDVDIPTP